MEAGLGLNPLAMQVKLVACTASFNIPDDVTDSPDVVLITKSAS